jgi:hypothetical protein
MRGRRPWQRRRAIDLVQHLEATLDRLGAGTAMQRELKGGGLAVSE